jgi:hypothetical protein
MTSTPFNYVSAKIARSRRRWLWLWRILIVVSVLAFLVIILPAVTVRQFEKRIDPVTGSMRSNTVWLFGITSGPRVDVSPLEKRLKSSGIAWTPSWQFLHNTHLNVFGNATLRECGIAPQIHQLRPVLKEFAAASTDAELREFVRILQSGTESEQKSAVDAAAEKGFQNLEAAQKGG